MNIPRICANHPVSVLMIYAALALTGLVSLLKLEVNLYPEINIPVANIVTECETLPDNDIETMITVPLENALSGVRGIREISSLSKEGISSVTLKFGWDTDTDRTGAEIREKIDAVYPLLPVSSKKPLLVFKDLADTPLMTLSLTPAGNKSMADISGIIETDFRTRLLSIDGVSQVRISGLAEKEIKIDVDYPSLVNTGLSLNVFTETVASSVFSLPAGKAYEGIREYRVTAETDIKTVNDLKNIPLPGRGGLKAGDIADIYEGEKEKTSYFHAGSRECAGIEVFKSGNAGMLNVSKRIAASLKVLEEVFKNDFSIQVIEDSSIPLGKSLKELIFSIAAGIAAASLVLIYIFRDLRISLTVISSLPSSLFIVIAFMFFRSITINIISLTALVIGTGMVFDNTIVVLEKLLDKKPLTPDETGTVVSGTMLSVSGSTATTILVFLPLLFVSGITGKLFADLAMTVMAFITASAFTAMTMPPALYVLLDLKNTETGKTGKLMGMLHGSYKKYSGNIRKTGLFLTILLFLLPLLLIIPAIKKEAVPPGRDKKITSLVSYPPGRSLAEYSAYSSEIEKAVLASGLAESVYVKGGVEKKALSERGSESGETSKAVFFIKGKKEAEGDTADFMASVENFFSDLDVAAETGRNDSFLDRLDSGRGNSKIVVVSDKREDGRKAAEEIASLLEKQGISAKISGNHLKNRPGYIIGFDAEGFSGSGITAADMGSFMVNAVRGKIAASIETGDEKETDIRVRYRSVYTDSPEKISSLKNPTEEGLFDSSSITWVSLSENYPALSRHDRKPSFTLHITPAPGKEKALEYFIRSYRNGNASIAPDHFSSDTAGEIISLFLLALVFVYIILGAQFESFTIPFRLMFTIPLSVSGSFLLLFTTGKSLNISSFLGILILTGTTVNTAILLFAELRENGSTIKSAAGKRFVPIVATTATTVTALLPAALNGGAQIQGSAAVSLIGGLVSGTAAVLILYPAIFGKEGACREGKSIDEH